MFIIDILKETGFLFLDMAPYLLIGLLFVGILNLLFNKELIIKYVGKNNFWSVFKAALFGIPLPLCSCGVVPSAVYMAKNGASKGSVVSFLISTPQTGIDSMIATYGMMGWVFAIFRPVAALIMGVIGGAAVRLINNGDHQLKETTFETLKSIEGNSIDACYDENENCEDDNCNCNTEKNKERGKFRKFFHYSFVEFLDDISVQFVIGLFISGIIAYLIPDGFFESSFLNNGIAGMLLMILVGVPMYVCATASIPIAVTLMLKGFSPGVAFVFLAVGPATNAASFTIIMNVLGKKTAILYVAVISITAIAFGLLLDKLFIILGINPIEMLTHMHGHDMLISEELKWILGGIFFILVIASLYRKLIISKIKSKEKSMESQTIKIDGMSCNHCVMNVKKAILAVGGVSEVDVNLEQKEAYIKGVFILADVEKAVSDVGYKVVK
ncbi:SO_0444 family Cu/Zn efflux transporter [Bacteroidota bacterium]